MQLTFKSRNMGVGSQFLKTGKPRMKTLTIIGAYLISTTSINLHPLSFRSWTKKSSILVESQHPGFIWVWCFPPSVGMLKIYGLILWIIAIQGILKLGTWSQRATKKNLTSMLKIKPAGLICSTASHLCLTLFKLWGKEFRSIRQIKSQVNMFALFTRPTMVDFLMALTLEKL